VADILEEMKGTVEIIEHQLEVVLTLIKILTSQFEKDERK